MIKTDGKLKKINAPYLLGYIFLPVLIAVASFVAAVLLPGDGGALFSTICMLLAILWWAFIGGKVYEATKKKKLAALDGSGFMRNHTFNGNGCTVAVDLDKGKVAILFRWNPSDIFVRPASALSGVHTEDGKSGVGIMAGSGRVRFCFVADGHRVNVNTFTSNRRWAMDSEEILTGISKADMMVEALVGAGAQAGR